ncbi:hypothetical protein FDECE_15778, partial [Fusarium decemcellulare]
MEKQIEYAADSSLGLLSTARLHYHRSKKAWTSCLVSLLVFVALCLGYLRFSPQFFPSGWKDDDDPARPSRLTRSYELETGVRWMNPDGGRWRVLFVCNGQSPCPTLYAEEGDLLEISVRSDIYAQSSIHLSGFGHPKTGPWNDGTAGLSQVSALTRLGPEDFSASYLTERHQFPTLPRSNWTTTYDTTGNWGLNWYIDHTSSASVDGLYGLVYVAPSPSRPRPYHLITNDTLELRQIEEAERAIHHAAIQNHQHRDTVWKLLRMRVEGSEYYCYDSILVN